MTDRMTDQEMVSGLGVDDMSGIRNSESRDVESHDLEQRRHCDGD